MVDFDRKNYYEVLEVPQAASLQEIHDAYQRARNAYSGDSVAMYSLMTQDECERILDQIEEAYSVLGIAEKRREYDRIRGFNQEHTPDGFNEKVKSIPDYKPRSKLSDMISETTNMQHNESLHKEEFQFNQMSTPKSEVHVSKVAAFKKFGLEYSIDNDFEQEIENATDFDGEFLKKIREYKNVTIERMADMTRISKTYIRNIEDNDFLKLPAEVYTRGFVYQYAKCLKLNPELVATSFLHHLQVLKTQKQ